MLATACRLRAAGAIHPDTALWCVANPLTESADRAAAKADAGADALLTQPPLDWAAWERWYAEAER